MGRIKAPNHILLLSDEIFALISLDFMVISWIADAGSSMSFTICSNEAGVVLIDSMLEAMSEKSFEIFHDKLSP